MYLLANHSDKTYIGFEKRRNYTSMDTDPAGAIMSQLLLLLFLTMVNAFFAASEMAIVSINRGRIHALSQQGHKKAKIVERLLDEPTNFLSTIQVAITLSGFFSSASAATGIAPYVGTWLSAVGIPFANQIASAGITILLVIFNLVFGELVPKRIALQKAEQVSMFAAKPIVIVGTIASPIIKFLSLATRLVLRVFGMNNENIEEQVSEEEIRSLLESGQEKGVFNETEREMIDSIFDFDDILASEIMTPRTDVYGIDINDDVAEYLDELMEMRYSRIPVYEEDMDHIIGILNVKDYVREARKVGFEKVDIRAILRKAYFIPETKNIDELFKEFQRTHQHIAILIDEYGGFSGLVTMEDLIEEVMGEIEDEYDVEEQPMKRLNENSIQVDGLCALHDLNEELNVSLPSDDYDTLNGFLLDQLGQIPADGETCSITYDNLRFDIEEVKEKRIRCVTIYNMGKKENQIKDEQMV